MNWFASHFSMHQKVFTNKRSMPQDANATQTFFSRLGSPGRYRILFTSLIPSLETTNVPEPPWQLHGHLMHFLLRRNRTYTHHHHRMHSPYLVDRRKLSSSSIPMRACHASRPLTSSLSVPQAVLVTRMRGMMPSFLLIMVPTTLAWKIGRQKEDLLHPTIILRTVTPAHRIHRLMLLHG